MTTRELEKRLEQDIYELSGIFSRHACNIEVVICRALIAQKLRLLREVNAIVSSHTYEENIKRFERLSNIEWDTLHKEELDHLIGRLCEMSVPEEEEEGLVSRYCDKVEKRVKL